ncbi:MAG: alanine racemase, partial [Bifidobacteriaceae bacterium]|nr:alanine racemase [Bifidobacteriaceae bacterium]
MGAPASAYPGRAVVDLDAIRANTAELRRRAGQAELMGIVKANAYGHGLVPSARAALAGGATWLGAAQLTEALALRAAIPGPPILAWLFAPGAPLREAVRAGIDLGVASDWALDAVGRAARAEGVQARVHLKIDTGLGRSGVPPEAWEAFVGRALRAEADGLVRALGCWSHFAYADAPDHPTVRAQKEVFRRAVETAEDLGARFEVRHLANSAALVTDAGANFDLVRPGLALYGLSPIPDIA